MTESLAAVSAAVADAHRREWSLVLAATVRVTRDLDLAEECVQEAYARALTDWTASGVPARPGAWLVTVSRRLALDALRRRSVLDRKLPLLVESVSGDVDTGTAGEADGDSDGDADKSGRDAIAGDDRDRLRLVFTCCHPALARDAQVALTLRFVCGLTTAEIARAFLVSEPTMAARVTRAKKKIAAARIPYRVPTAEDLPERTTAVLDVVHLLFTTGHTAPLGDGLVRHDLVERALDLGRMLRSLLPDDPDVAGLLALILLTDARRATRLSDDGRLLLLQEQDRRRWDRAAISEGVALVREALGRRPPGRFALQAAIAAVHAEAPRWEDTDWDEIVSLYDELTAVWPSPVVSLNRAVAVGFAEGPIAGLAAIDELEADPRLSGYGYLHSARADFLRRVGAIAEARASYERAWELSANEVERGFLRDRISQLID